VLTVAYLANQFPVAVEPYVSDEIYELRGRGVEVIPGSVRAVPVTRRGPGSTDSERQIFSLHPLRLLTLVRALALVARPRESISSLMAGVLLRGRESPMRRLKALLHTWLGAYYALLLQGRRVGHIHAHHGYFGSWVAMVAARLLGVSFSLTLHGSDLLIDGAYLGTKLENCLFCVTISEYNRRYILKHFPTIDPRRIVVSRLGVDAPGRAELPREARDAPHRFTLLTVGRLHAVKDHAFLVRACAQLRDQGLDFECAIAGDGPERGRLERLIRKHGLEDRFRLLGHVLRPEIDSLYRRADLVVLTSRSEGLPLVLMEAMARGRIVVAPAITGIPEIVIPGKTGFLYIPGLLEDFVQKILFLDELMHSEDRNAVSRLNWIRHAARVQVLHNFSRRKNLTRFGDSFLRRIANPEFALQDWSTSHEDLVLQQI
jgi:colanic acid/amylovoran biosynthesis glycosyltransferase